MHKLFCSGDFVILLSTGLKWPIALLFNFLSSLTALVGFFVGVTIGTSSVESNNWILTAAIGLFLYVALVDLVRLEVLYSTYLHTTSITVHICIILYTVYWEILQVVGSIGTSDNTANE